MQTRDSEPGVDSVCLANNTLRGQPLELAIPFRQSGLMPRIPWSTPSGLVNVRSRSTAQLKAPYFDLGLLWLSLLPYNFLLKFTERHGTSRELARGSLESANEDH